MNFEKIIEDVVRRVVREVVREELAAASKPADLVTVKAYAAARSISESTVRKAIRNGRLPAEKLSTSESENATAVRIPANADITAPVKAAKARETLADRAERIARGGGK